MDKMFNQLAKSSRIDVFKNSLNSLEKARDLSKKIREDEAEATKKNSVAQEKMLKNFASGLEQQLNISTKALLKAQEKVQRAVRRGNEEEMKAAMSHAANLSKTVDDVMARARQGAKEIEAHNKAMEKSNEVFTEHLRDREEKVKELGKAGYIAQEKILGTVVSSVEALKDGISSLESTSESIFGKLSGFFHKKAGKLDLKASKEKDVDKAKGMMELAGTFGKVAKSIAVIGGSITLLVSLFSMAEGAVKDMNKSILEGASYTDLMAVSGEDVQDSFKKLRKAFTDGSFLDEIAATSDEFVAFYRSLNEANLGIRTLGSGDKGISLMRDTMKQLKAETLAMGISMEDAVSRANEFAYEVGVSVKDGAFLRSMVADFADIRDMAIQTGYSTANFYTKVKGLTDELDNMNLRTKEAGALFVRLSRIVGPEGVSGLLSGSGIKNEDYLDQIQRQMLTSKDKVSTIMKAEAERSAQAFLGTFNTSKKGMGMLGAAGIREESIIADMQKMTTEQRQKLLGDLAMSDDTAGMGRELATLFDMARASKKGASRTDISRGFDAMGAGGALATQYARLETHLGGRDVSGVLDIEKKALMEFTGLSKEQLEQFGRMQDVYKGQFKEAQSLASKGSLTEDEDKRLKAMGLEKREDKIVMKDTGIEVKDIATFILAQGESLEKSKEVQLSQEELLHQNVIATVSLADRINKYLGEILMDISGGIMDIVNAIFGKKEDDKVKEMKKELVDQLTVKISKQQEENSKRMQKKGELERRLAVSKGSDKDKVQKELDLVNKEMEKEEKKKKILKEQRKTLLNTTYGDDVRTYGKEYLNSLSGGAAYTSLGKSGVLESPEEVQKKRRKRQLEGLNKELGSSYKNFLDLNLKKEAATDPKVQKALENQGLEYNKQLRDIVEKEGNQTWVSRRRITGGQSQKKLAMHEFDLLTQDSGDRKKEAVDQAKAVAKDSTVTKAQEKQNKNLAEEMVEAQKRDKLRSLASSLGGIEFGTDTSAETLAERINKRGFSKEQLQGYGYEDVVLRELGIKVDNISDGLFTGGKMYRFDRADDILAMKPGGAVDRLGSSGVVNATINVNGAGDPDMVAKAVLREVDKLRSRTRGGSK